MKERKIQVLKEREKYRKAEEYKYGDMRKERKIEDR